MTRAELIQLLSERFYENFADKAAAQVCSTDAVGVLYELVSGRAEGLPRAVRHKVLFRGAYVLERIYFDAPGVFIPWVEDFCRRGFPECCDASARRHFGKIMAYLLGNYVPEPQTLERIADAAGEWAVDSQAKVAVRIWAVEVLKHCRGRVAWVDESWNDVLEALRHAATPGISNRLRKSWK